MFQKKSTSLGKEENLMKEISILKQSQDTIITMLKDMHQDLLGRIKNVEEILSLQEGIGTLNNNMLKYNQVENNSSSLLVKNPVSRKKNNDLLVKNRSTTHYNNQNDLNKEKNIKLIEQKEKKI